MGVAPTMNQPPKKPAPGDTQVIDLQDVELLVAEHAQQLQEQEHQRSLPPPLPPEVRASRVPSEPPPASLPPSAPSPSIAPAPGRSSAFYLVAVLAFLVVGIGGGLLVAMKMRKPPATAATTPAASGQAAVITIPTVEVDDDPDGGK